MTSLKLKFRPSRVAGKAGALYIQVIHDRVTRQISLGCKIYPHEWEYATVVALQQEQNRTFKNVFSPCAVPNLLKLCHGEKAKVENQHRQRLLKVQEHVRKSKGRLEGIINQLEQQGKDYTADDVVNAYKLAEDAGERNLCVFAAKVIQHLRDIGKVRLTETYTSSINSFMRFRGEKGDIRMEDMNSDLMKEYECYLLKERGLNPNTSSFYMRNLRAIYNRAVDNEMIADRRPFRHVFTGVGKTIKRAVPAETMREIKNLDLSMSPTLAMARDLFMLSFFLRGISFVDLAKLKLTDIKNGYLHYRRQKTNQALVIKWGDKMQEIVSRYHLEGSPYLLPVIAHPDGDVRRQCQYALCRVNARLKKIGEMVNCPIKLTTYCARHAWASTARNMNIPIAIISEAMGHESEKTTRIYLNSLDNRMIDEANQRVMNAV